MGVGVTRKKDSRTKPESERLIEAPEGAAQRKLRLRDRMFRQPASEVIDISSIDGPAYISGPAYMGTTVAMLHGGAGGASYTGGTISVTWTMRERP